MGLFRTLSSSNFLKLRHETSLDRLPPGLIVQATEVSQGILDDRFHAGTWPRSCRAG